MERDDAGVLGIAERGGDRRIRHRGGDELADRAEAVADGAFAGCDEALDVEHRASLPRFADAEISPPDANEIARLDRVVIVSSSICDRFRADLLRWRHAIGAFSSR
jgi:hypothetical protein